MQDHARYQRLLHRHLPGSRLLRAWPLQGGSSASMIALETLTAAETSVWVVRRPAPSTLQANPQAGRDEFERLRWLAANAIPAPRALAYDDSGEILPSPYLLLAYQPGQPDFSPQPAADSPRQMAEALARIHAVNVAGAGRFLPVPASGPLPALPTNAALDAARILPHLAAAWPVARHNPLVLLHGDFWPGNLLWQAGDLVAVLDWEDARLGDPLEDLAISRLDLLWIAGQAQMEDFTRQYLARTAADPASLPGWDLYAALRLARLVGADLDAWAAFFLPYDRADITPGHIRATFKFFVDQALERLS